MRTDYQKIVFETIKNKIGNESLGNVVGDLLNISSDAVYRRYRGETQLTIFELEKLSKHFNFSLDSIFELRKNTVLFNFRPLDEFDFSMDVYIESLLEKIKLLKTKKNPELMFAVNNIQIFQLLNYPHLVRFKLFFWAKNYLNIKEYDNLKFKYEKISSKTFSTGLEALKIYNTIPSKEIYDNEFLKGFVSEVYYNFKSRLFDDPNFALYILDVLDRFIDHLELQAIAGKKFVSTTNPPANGNEFEMYYKPTNNGNGSALYKTDDERGMYISHNMLNFLHTTDSEYIDDSFGLLKKQVANSSKISSINEQERNIFFFNLKKMVERTRSRIQAELASDY